MEVRCYGGPYHGKVIEVKDGMRSLEVVEQQDPISIASLGDSFNTYLSPLIITVPIEQDSTGGYVAYWPDYEQNSLSGDWTKFERHHEIWVDSELGKALIDFSKVVEELK